MTFNQELITKARKGEIAILNDGSVEELKIVLTAIWPNDTATAHINSCSHKHFVKHPYCPERWYGDQFLTYPTAHSVKDFFMDQPESKDQPRTYRVTRQQMGEIDLHRVSGTTEVIYNIMASRFKLFDVEAELTDTDVSMLNSIVPDVDILKSIFPEYFFIPEGEPVLVRDRDDEPWKPGISDGEGEVQLEFGGPSWGFKQIIPYTKQPPK